MSKLIYLDNAATTQVYPEVLQEMLPYFSEVYSNPSAIYSFASESKKAVDKARTSVAELINAKTDEIYFTGGGSESDNWALKATGNGLHPCLIGFPKTYPADKSIIHCTIRLSTNYF